MDLIPFALSVSNAILAILGSNKQKMKFPALDCCLTILILLQLQLTTFFVAECVSVETRTLDQIYQAAIKEGGRLVIYAGGDVASQQTSTKTAFEARFPKVKLDIVVDYSKFHGPRIDLQLANNSLACDLVQIQSLQNFPRWKQEGHLLAYKPAGWDKIYKDFRDDDAYYTGFDVAVFGYLINSGLVAPKNWPKSSNDYLKARFKGKLAVTYPNDDDAVMFWFKQTIDKYGWQWMDKFVRQNPIYVRGTQAPTDLMANNSASVSMTTYCAARAFLGNSSTLQFSMPPTDPLTIWAQTAAIFKQAKHPEAAKLYLNWKLQNDPSITNSTIWSVRTDVQPASGYRPIWQYPNSSHKKFVAFLQNTTALDTFRTQLTLYVGEPLGPPSPGIFGLYPDPNV